MTNELFNYCVTLFLCLIFVGLTQEVRSFSHKNIVNTPKEAILPIRLNVVDGDIYEE